MRQNGLRASSFVPVVDVDPRVADQLLDLLRLADVAAYSEPAPGSTGLYRDHHVSSRRLDRLWVDRSETQRARAVLDRALPHLQAELEVAIRDGVVIARETAPGELVARPVRSPDPTSETDLLGRAEPPADPAVEGARAEIGLGEAGLVASAEAAGSPAGSGRPGREAAELHSSAAAESAGPEAAADAAAGDPTPPRAPRPSGGMGDVGRPVPPTGDFDDSAVESKWAQIVAGFDTPVSGPAPWPSAEDLPGPRITRLRRPARSLAVPPPDVLDPSDHFVPPVPQQLPRLDAMTRVGWAAVIGGPIVLVLVVVFGGSLPGWVPLLGVLILVGGFGLLVSRLRPSSNDDDSDHHDGAVV